MTQQKALIAMSGGVDSSVAALLIKQAGMRCIGAMMRLYNNDAESPDGDKTCCTLDDAEDARAVARRLGFPFYVFNFRDDFEQQVIQKFIRCYECGLTPNPCIDCNRYLKFDRLLRRATELECDYIVTGHYARVRYDEISGRYLLLRACDESKDQSYVLYALTQDQLSHTLLPLGELTKTEVRAIAERNGLINAHKRDSQDICFVPDGDYASFIAAYTGTAAEPGNFLSIDGRIVGQHRGAICYTLGQRKGLGLAMGAPVYVCAKNMDANTVTVGPNEALYARTLRAGDWNFFPFAAPTGPLRVTAKARYNQAPQPATAYPESDGAVRVEFDAPQRALTPGQAIVLYDGETVVGGGTITEVLPDTV